MSRIERLAEGVTLYLGDCREILPTLGKVDACVTDPPYGIGMDGGNVGYKGFNDFEKLDWDKIAPDQELFDLVLKSAERHIIWGGNYFLDHLGSSQGFVIWDKKQPQDFSLAMCELAWSSIQAPAKIFRYSVLAGESKQHPTQKPMALYRWLVKNYAKQGDRILDTHVGSASSLVVYEEMGFEYVGFELDADYYRDSCKRLEAFRAQPKLFTGSEIFEASKPPTLF